METVLIVAFVLGVVGLVSPHLFYPPMLYFLSRLRAPRLPGKAQPSVSLIISAYNEEQVIRAKIENALALDYPAEKLEVLVISDASDDATDKIVAEYADRRVRLCRQEQRHGKSAGLTRFCPEASGEVLVFTDANAMFKSDAIEKLVRHFDEPKIGYTVGRQLYESPEGGASAASENIYWNIELKLKEWESRLSSVVGADGAIYALRKKLFEPLANEDINDFYLPLRVVTKGFSGMFDPDAICFEEAAPNFKGEFRRKYRIVNRSLRAVTKVPGAFDPLRVGWFALQLFVHKVLRWLSPIFLLLILISSAMLAAREFTAGEYFSFFSLVLACQIFCYLLAGAYALPFLRGLKLIYVAFYFLLINVAAAIGIGLLISGRTINVWKPQR
jgi:cellulose synthase/poly-beta-1,6-N-acetylglucosamine synthase-like glycosyltransferase